MPKMCAMVPKCVAKYPQDPQDPPPSNPQIPRPTDRPTDDGVQSNEHPKYRASPDFQSRGEFEIWILAYQSDYLSNYLHNYQYNYVV